MESQFACLIRRNFQSLAVCVEGNYFSGHLHPRDLCVFEKTFRSMEDENVLIRLQKHVLSFESYENVRTDLAHVEQLQNLSGKLLASYVKPWYHHKL